jgi:hypothetical protein
VRVTRWTAHGVRVVAASSAAVVLAVRVWVLASGYLLGDDYVLTTRAYGLPLWSQELLLEPFDGKVTPAVMWLAGVSARIAPLQYWFLLLTTLLLLAAGLALSWRLVGRVWGWRPLALVPWGLLALGPAALLPMSWWTASTAFLPPYVATLGAVVCMLNVLRGPRRLLWSAGALGWLAFALAFGVTGVALPVVVLAAVWVVAPGADRAGPRLRGVLRGGAAEWAVLAAVSAAGAAWVLPRLVLRPGALADNPATWFMTLAQTATSLVPSAGAGPWAWAPVPGVVGFPDPPGAVVVLAWAALGVLVAWGCWVSARARLAWIAAVAVAATTAAWLSIESPLAAPVVAASLRADAYLVVVLAVAAGVSLAPVRGEEPRLRAEGARGRLAAQPSLLVPVSLALCYLLVAGVLVSTAALQGPVRANASVGWVEGVLRSTQARAQTHVLDQVVPTTVAVAPPTNRYSGLLAPLAPQLTVDTQTEELLTIDATGQVVAGVIDGTFRVGGPDPACTTRISRRVATVFLQSAIAGGSHTVSIDYRSGSDVDVQLSLGGGPVVGVRLAAGSHTVFTNILGAGDRLTLRAPEASRPIGCLTFVAVGAIAPLAAP